MRWWPGWDFRRSPFDEGQVWDLRTYGGVLRFAIMYGVGLWGAWFIDDFFVWQDLVAKVDPREQQWHRVGVIGLAIVGAYGVLGAVALIVVRRRRERQIRESAKGQWYDRADLTSEELYGSLGGEGVTECEDDSLTQRSPRPHRQ